MATVSESVLTPQLLARCRERAPEYDRENRFFKEDFDELKAAGYLRMALPGEFGGLGMNVAEVGRETRKLAMYAPATALALNMHHYWVGDAADVWRSGDKSLNWLLDEAAAGEVFAAGHAEHGNDIPGLLSTTKAEKVDGGYTFTGRTSVATAELLGQQATVFPSHHGGFLGGEFGYAGQPEAFARKLRDVLDTGN